MPAATSGSPTSRVMSSATSLRERSFLPAADNSLPDDAPSSLGCGNHARSHASPGRRGPTPMNRFLSRRSRREFLRTMSLGAVAFAAPGAFAEELVRTPKQTEGPFYPDKLPLDTDNDLIIINDSTSPAVGQVTYLGGRILDS